MIACWKTKEQGTVLLLLLSTDVANDTLIEAAHVQESTFLEVVNFHPLQYAHRTLILVAIFM